EIAREWWMLARNQGFAPALLHSVFTSDNNNNNNSASLLELFEALKVGHPLALLRVATRVCQLGATESSLAAPFQNKHKGAFSLYEQILKTAENHIDYPSAVAEAYRSL